MSSTEAALLGFWGKARPGRDAPSWHPLAWHLLDVAAVGERLLVLRPALARTLAQDLAWPLALVHRAVPALLALHDLGKFTPAFQAKVPELWPAGALGPQPELVGRDPGHERSAWTLFEALLEDEAVPLFDRWRHDLALAIMQPIFGHHGRPVEPARGLPLDLLGRQRRAVSAAAAWIKLVAALFDLPAALPVPPPGQLRRASWRLAGLMTLADWIGSARSWFPYTPPSRSIEAYWHEAARPQAERALADAGLAMARSTPFGGHAHLVGGRFPPTAAQAWAAQVDLPEGPLLVVLEDITGSGKTEAALLLVHRLMAAGRADGLVLALPTQATANAMFARMGEVYRRLFEPAACPSLALAHGGSRLHLGFQDALRIGSLPAGEGDQSSAACSAWLGSEGRKAFLADVGIATIDQAILAILPARFQALRLLGMAERVLVIDEAHAYDAYVGRELEELVRWQAAMGGHTIVLSATLPAAKRADLIGAYTCIPAKTASDGPYPLVTLAHRGGAAGTPLAPRPDLVRAVEVVRVATPEGVLAEIKAAVAAGAAVAWIRNTVDDVLEGLALLSSQGIAPIVFHARFAMADRLAVEQQVLAKFGRGSAGTGRSGVVIASQVIEMSLDLDFDLVITDLAPIDSILQRIGRAWRHVRPSRPIEGSRVLVLAPEPVDEPPQDWLAPALVRTGYVYTDHAVLWRTARCLFAQPMIAVPDDVPQLIAAVFDPAGKVPVGLARSAAKAEGERSAQGAIAGSNVLQFEKGYASSNGAWDSEIRIPTRDAVDAMTFRLARVQDGRVLPWCDQDAPHAWERSEIRLRRNRAEQQAPDQQVGEAALAAAKLAWKEFEREMPLLVLHPAAAGEWHGQVLDHRGGLVRVCYTTSTGLRFAPADA